MVAPQIAARISPRWAAESAPHQQPSDAGSGPALLGGGGAARGRSAAYRHIPVTAATSRRAVAAFRQKCGGGGKCSLLPQRTRRRPLWRSGDSRRELSRDEALAIGRANGLIYPAASLVDRRAAGHRKLSLPTKRRRLACCERANSLSPEIEIDTAQNAMRRRPVQHL